MKNKEEKLYELAKELFIKRSPPEFLTDKTENGFKSAIENSIKVAKMFLEHFEKDKKDGTT